MFALVVVAVCGAAVDPRSKHTAMRIQVDAGGQLVAAGKPAESSPGSAKAAGAASSGAQLRAGALVATKEGVAPEQLFPVLDDDGGKSQNKDHSTGWFPFPDPDWGNETPSAYDVAVARAPTPPPSVSPYSFTASKRACANMTEGDLCKLKMPPSNGTCVRERGYLLCIDSDMALLKRLACKLPPAMAGLPTSTDAYQPSKMEDLDMLGVRCVVNITRKVEWWQPAVNYFVAAASADDINASSNDSNASASGTLLDMNTLINSTPQANASQMELTSKLTLGKDEKGESENENENGALISKFPSPTPAPTEPIEAYNYVETMLKVPQAVIWSADGEGTTAPVGLHKGLCHQQEILCHSVDLVRELEKACKDESEDAQCYVMDGPQRNITIGNDTEAQRSGSNGSNGSNLSSLLQPEPLQLMGRRAAPAIDINQSNFRGRCKRILHFTETSCLVKALEHAQALACHGRYVGQACSVRSKKRPGFPADPVGRGGQCKGCGYEFRGICVSRPLACDFKKFVNETQMR